MDVDVDADEAEGGIRDRLPDLPGALARVASPLPSSRQRRLTQVHSVSLSTVGIFGRETEAKAVVVGGGTVTTPAHLDIAGTCFDPRGSL
jgi:hypothetical protein